MLSGKNDNPRLLLAKLRKADYTHAGDEEAIDIFLEKINKLFSTKSNITPPLKALDAGCGLGGTADYIKKRTSFKIFGIDIDTTALKHAKQHYPEINLFECDIMHVDKIFDINNFDLIYLFNVFYALPDQQKSLSKLARVARPGAILAIFDYTQASTDSIELKDLTGKIMNPVYMARLKEWLKNAGWELIEIIDLSDKYEKWYTTLIENLKAQKNNLLNEFTETSYEKVLSTFSFLASKIKNREMGGSIIYAKCEGMVKSRL